MDAVPCGVDENSGKSFAGEILGTDGAHKKSREMLCQESVLKTEGVMYRIRPRGDKHPVLLRSGSTQISGSRKTSGCLPHRNSTAKSASTP